MGMFDDLRCDHPLPDGKVVEGAVWQTKDFNCDMSLVVITEDGRLLLERWHWEDVPEEERPGYGKPGFEEKGSLTRVMGSLRRVVDEVYEYPYHGDAHFYRLAGDRQLEEYRARFTEGRLSSIDRVDDTLNSPQGESDD